MNIILIAAMDSSGVIGNKNNIPWHIPEEMLHFKETTMGHAVIMGRKTYESIGSKLPGRENYILSSNPDFTAQDCTVTTTLDEAIRCCRHQEKVFIIGGRTIYQLGYEYADTILLSVIHKSYTGDTYFPEIPKEQFQLTAAKEISAEPPFTLYTYKRITATPANNSMPETD